MVVGLCGGGGQLSLGMEICVIDALLVAILLYIGRGIIDIYYI